MSRRKGPSVIRRDCRPDCLSLRAIDNTGGFCFPPSAPCSIPHSTTRERRQESPFEAPSATSKHQAPRSGFTAGLACRGLRKAGTARAFCACASSCRVLLVRSTGGPQCFHSRVRPQTMHPRVPAAQMALACILATSVDREVRFEDRQASYRSLSR
jgi:hypothetical protein